MAAWNSIRRALGDSNRTGMVVGALLIVAGFVTIAVTWRAVAARLEVPLQLPYLLSGSFAGLGVIAVGLAVINVQATRRLNAMRRRQLDRLLDEAAELAARYSKR
ncbi:MAG: hypothetical protein ACRD0U_05295 [Acidimicrobiales bacterium]